MSDDTEYTVITHKEEADWVTDEELESALGWFLEKRGVPTMDFFDRLFTGRYGPAAPHGPALDLDQVDNEAAKSLLKRARAMKREMDDYNLS